MRVKFSMLVFLLPFFIISCQKGNTGPAGAAGPAGPAGPQGPQGPAGTANVIYSQWFTPGSYTKDTIFGEYGFSYTKATTDITQQVLDSGVVLTFGKLDGYNVAIWPSAQVAQLPITVTYRIGSTIYNDTWSALATVGNLKIRFVDDQNYYSSISNKHQFRYVIIPGGMKSTVASVSPGLHSGRGTQLSSDAVSEVARNYRQMSYSEICRRLNIPE
ncbi:hypothetical protein [Puia dinghuensis]|uniref:Collagen-like protein n=1 Tax=Puia dinghuensis TaxID=1792502 RepID=A0A8J2XS12_9BACT|nr:hypothetical protein [Puia dinghuensis]GGA89013.1 hypothetical protein GCM10011511_10340 [Puia dinghuensis]